MPKLIDQILSDVKKQIHTILRVHGFIIDIGTLEMDSAINEAIKRNNLSFTVLIKVKKGGSTQT